MINSVTFANFMTSFTQYIRVKEFEPFANFWAISAETVDSSYKYSDAPIISLPIDNIPNGMYMDSNGIEYPFVSGYAPKLTVWFQDSSEHHTFPISSYHWNFGDPYNEGPKDIFSFNSNYFTVTNSEILSGEFMNPNWETPTQAHTAVHTYIMPGTYNVTLTVKASCTSTSDVCARYIDPLDTKKFYIYVKEIPPECGEDIKASLKPTTEFVTDEIGISGNSPLTGYFMASSIIAGSFPICRIDWDFGDGTIQKITRRPSMTATDSGIPLININAYPYDLEDPRNFIVPHIYINKTMNIQSFDIHISAYACNTNTMIHCSAAKLVKKVLPEWTPPQEDNKKIIGSRFDDDGNLIYIIEGENNLTTYTVTLTGEL